MGILNEKRCKKFIISYVQCSICKSLETYIRRDSANRLSFLECLSCKSNRALSQINQVVKIEKIYNNIQKINFIINEDEIFF